MAGALILLILAGVQLWNHTASPSDRQMAPGIATTNRSPASASTITPTGADQKSIAVLPFVNMTTDKADDYLSDGISEEIITALSKIKGLKVPARTSCFAFKGRNEDIRPLPGYSSVLKRINVPR